MLPGGGSFGSPRGVFSFQMLRKNVIPTSALKETWGQATSNASGFYQQRKSTIKPAYGAKPPLSHKELIDRYKQGDAHPVSLLHQLAQGLQFHMEIKETVTTENIPGLYFAFCVVIDGIEYKTGVGKTKKDAKLNAAELALNELLPTLESDQPVLPEMPDIPPLLPLKDEFSMSEPCFGRPKTERKNCLNLQIPHAVRDQLSKLMKSLEFSVSAGTTAAFILQTSKGCEVVALGTGDFSIKETDSISGRIVHDSHAVVTARRSLMRFLYRHLLMFFSKTANLTERSIFQQSGSSNLLTLKSGITLHLYLNQLPKGAAQIPSHLRLNPLSMSALQVINEMSLHLSVEGKVFSVFSSAFDHSTSKVISISGTDKVTQWQVLGYQGALLSHFIEPIYVHSILVGDSCCNDVRGITMSVSQRVEGITSQLPMYYCMMRPHISMVPSVAVNTTSGGSTFCVNWSEGDSSLEVVDGLMGKTIEESPFKSSSALASRLCKAAMLHRFKLVAKEAQRQDLLAASSYREAKRMAKPYQEAKNVLRAFLSQQGFGSWPAKLSVIDNFSIESSGREKQRFGRVLEFMEADNVSSDVSVASASNLDLISLRASTSSTS